ncbi:MAG: hypothetical protein E7052_03660 [Lentisphaerae bacterium]|nr:hypothetical protein [Lentisphaerota bacterium]
MLKQQEMTELVNSLNRRQDERSLLYAMAAGLIAFSIMLFGLTMLYSTSFATVGEKFLYAQLRWAFIGTAAMLTVIFLGYRRIGSWCPWLLSLLAILLIWAALSKPINGANRWIIIPWSNMRFQPSEMAKVVLSLYGAQIIADNLRNVADFRKFKQLIRPAVIIGVILLLVVAGKDLGTTLLLATAMGSLAFSGGLQKRLLLVIPIVLAVLTLYLTVFDPERLSRVTSFTNPGDTTLRDTDGYQLWNSQLALGSGGLYGIGFMESRMKMRYLPEAHTDFILAVVGEELGFIGLLCVVAGYLAFGYFGMKIALNSRSRYGMLLAQTLTLLIVLQAAINIGVVAGGLPTKGISAPLISYGGSNLLMNMIMVGLLISVGLENVPGLTDNWPLRKKSTPALENSSLPK